MSYTIDRFEGNYAVCEDEKRERILLLLEEVPSSAVEGDILTFRDGIFQVDLEATAAQRKKVLRTMSNLRESDSHK